MINLTHYPLLVFALSFLVLWLSERIGSSIIKRQRNMAEDVREDFGVILSATLTQGRLFPIMFVTPTLLFENRNQDIHPASD